MNDIKKVRPYSSQATPLHLATCYHHLSNTITYHSGYKVIRNQKLKIKKLVYNKNGQRKDRCCL